jgi:hypothetical protein
MHTPAMGARHRRTQFAVPFIAILGCGGRQAPEEPARDVPGQKWDVSGYAGECDAHSDEGRCPKGAMCNPPPPAPIECPAGHQDGARHRIVERPDKTCAIIPDGCIELACATVATPCPDEPGAPRKLKGTFWRVTHAAHDCLAREDTCTDASCARALECPASLAADGSIRVAEVRGGCAVVADGCADTSCVQMNVACPVAVGADLGALKWLGQRSGDTCTVTSTGPIAGERAQTIACPNDPKASQRFQIDRAMRAEPCVYRTGTAPAMTTPCPP